MAIPVGTTARQTETVARWMLTGIVLLGMLTWWWPGYQAWGALAAALLIVFALWLIKKIAAAERKVLGHPLYLVLLGPACVLAYHLASTSLKGQDMPFHAVGGAMNVSMLFQMGLLAVGVLLSQGLLSKAVSHISVLSVCGAAMMCGSAAALVWGRAYPVRNALAFLGFAGIGVWLSPLWALRPANPLRPSVLVSSKPLRRLCLGVGVAFGVMLMLAAAQQAIAAAVVVAGVLLLAALIFHKRRARCLVGGVVSLAVAAILSLIIRPEFHPVGAYSAGALGRGESAFCELSSKDSGLVVLGATTGWAGLMWLLGGMVVCVVWLLGHSRRQRQGDQARAIAWTSASVLTLCAFLSTGGPFMPAVTLGAAFTWGLLPLMLGRQSAYRPGAILLVAWLAVMMPLGLARSEGLVSWCVQAFGMGDTFLHVLAGFYLALLVVWLMGVNRIRLGLVAILLVALAGGVVEVLQSLVGRGPSLAAMWEYLFAPPGTKLPNWLRDWLCHSLGAALAVVPYLLAMGARACESADARHKDALSSYDLGA